MAADTGTPPPRLSAQLVAAGPRLGNPGEDVWRSIAHHPAEARSDRCPVVRRAIARYGVAMAGNTDALLAPGSDLWRTIRPGVRIAVVRGTVPHSDFDGWEGVVRKEGVLAVEALRWLDDTSQSAKAKWSTTSTRLASEELAVVDEARAMPRAAIASVTG